MIKPQILKGFRDFLPQQARKRQYVIDKLKTIFELYGFEPLETPTLEYEEILTGKYGEEGEKLMYRFEDHGKRRVAMRYDQTVPLARVVAQYANSLSMPFKRYQIQPVWRADNTQRGRFREFVQCDIDTIGTDSSLADAEIIALIINSYKTLGFTKCKVLINDRNVFGSLPAKAISIIDKLKKIGNGGVVQELVTAGFAPNAQAANEALTMIMKKNPTEYGEEIFHVLQQVGIDKTSYEFSPTLARGLDYYTGSIIEVETPEYPHGSLGGGGRYDKLIGMFADKQISAVGFAFGFDRIIEAMDELNLFPVDVLQSATKVLVTIFSADLKEKSLEMTSQLRSNGINTELYLGDNTRLDKQLKYADQKGIPYTVIIGPEEKEKDMVTLKNLKERTQKQMSVDELIKMLQ